MDPIVTVLITTAAGALIGTVVGVLLMRRQLRPIISETALADLKTSLQRSEASLAATTTNAEDLGKQLAQRDERIQQASDDLKQKQQQLDLLLAEAQAETVRRTTAEQRNQELSTQTGVLTEQYTSLSAKACEQEKQLAERATRLASLQGELDTNKQFAEGLKEEVARVTKEAVDLRSSMEQEGRYRTSLEAQLRTEQEQIGQLNNKVEELQTERAQLEIRLQEERQSAAKGMELLMMAQEKLAGVFKCVGLDPQTASGGNGSNTSSHVDVELHARAAAPESGAIPRLPEPASS
jgi:chromosome segregation ATPase